MHRKCKVSLLKTLSLWSIKYIEVASNFCFVRRNICSFLLEVLCFLPVIIVDKSNNIYFVLWFIPIHEKSQTVDKYLNFTYLIIYNVSAFLLFFFYFFYYDPHYVAFFWLSLFTNSTNPSCLQFSMILVVTLCF